MKVYQTQAGVFVKKWGKVYLYVGDGFLEVPLVTAKVFKKLQEANDES